MYPEAILTPSVLESCYRSGAFPMADGEGNVEFYRADPRCILELDGLRVSKSLARVVRSGKFQVEVNRDFEAVVWGCADRRETWISPGIVRAYVELHRAGKAHSVEAYHEGRLVGGLYGVALGGFFGGESMFSRMSDASKVCLVKLVERLKERGYTLLDCQIQNDHLKRLGATEIPEKDFFVRLERALALERSFD
ncbi:aat: leucyl/phenylalanyl-tRNA--protein transferase [Rubrobacter radiotolerans]|uniref:Leucyl/phenylalanyl-tRNA--protein transferase n=1 Tax=Rubrobacter radiotolerans TaxID=42256 RepID=A0A023X2M1_RUBRA|nr:leucyl/phenylalanyl-tRNA--protein transferase [Rubrobacter radiotolerans]AHY46319.1 aat: leucyl/phenylalanyl-tRNA--protein transferase [Rubrobacter radiotolerans]MDX5893726.1 leucyl/phenylalanyl-tRNA--protein transferase [Rubrobacter radiotolerans]SMC04365.1 leucyl/phenylalanyl-tRNA--protein transferase [Rubrobacter radiotolerans DSM 5868]